jgi:secondary thiamine-phosphate synthase enzyme
MAVKSETITLSTKGNADILDITDQVSRVVAASGLNDGVITLFTASSTSGLTTIEYESGCIKDLRRLFDEIIDPARHYDHNARWGDGNGHSHVRAALLGASFSVPFADRRLTLGTWQQIIFIDFDNRSRRREVVVQIIGE